MSKKRNIFLDLRHIYLMMCKKIISLGYLARNRELSNMENKRLDLEHIFLTKKIRKILSRWLKNMSLLTLQLIFQGQDNIKHRL